MIVLWLIVDERIASANDRWVEDIRCMTFEIERTIGPWGLTTLYGLTLARVI